MTSKRFKFVQSAPWLQQQPDDLIRLVASRSVSIRMGPGRLVYDQEDSGTGLYGVVSGMVCFTTSNAETPNLSHVIGAGAWFGALAAVTEERRVVGALTLSECRLLFLSAAVVNEIAQDHPHMWPGLARLMAQNSLIAYQIVQDYTIRDPACRCRAVLRRLANSIGTGEILPLSQEQLAEMCLMSRGRLSRVLGDLENQGLVERAYRGLRLLDGI